LKSGVCNGNLKIPAKPLQTFLRRRFSGAWFSLETKKLVMEISKFQKNHYKPLKNNLAQATGFRLKPKSL